VAHRHGAAQPDPDPSFARSAPGVVALAWGVAGLIVVAAGLFLDGQASQRELLRTLAIAPPPVALAIQQPAPPAVQPPALSAIRNPAPPAIRSPAPPAIGEMASAPQTIDRAPPI